MNRNNLENRILPVLLVGDANGNGVIWLRLGVWIEIGDGEYECGVIERDDKIDSSLLRFDETDTDGDDDDES